MNGELLEHATARGAGLFDPGQINYELIFGAGTLRQFSVKQPAN